MSAATVCRRCAAEGRFTWGVYRWYGEAFCLRHAAGIGGHPEVEVIEHVVIEGVEA